MRHDGSDAVRQVTLTTRSGHSFTLRYTLHSAAQALAAAQKVLSSVTRPGKPVQMQKATSGLRSINTVDGKAMNYVG